MSFKDSCWVAHITPPTTGQFQRASMFVLLSRFASWDAVKILTPLWAPNATPAEINAVIDKFFALTQLRSDLTADIVRLKAAADDTATNFSDMQDSVPGASRAPQ